MGPLYDGPNPLPCLWQEVKTLKSDTKEIQSKMGHSPCLTGGQGVYALNLVTVMPIKKMTVLITRNKTVQY